MQGFDEDNIELRGLDQLVKALKIKTPMIKIGVLGGGRNAEVGAVHEFGAPARNIPQRSFLRIPLSENLEKELETSRLIDPDTLKEVIKTGTILPWMQKVSVAAIGVVDDAFETSGSGQWPTWKDPNYHNQGGMLLVDTGQLRDSITTEIIS